MAKFFSTEKGTVLRMDLIRAALLAILVILAWCMVYDRWTIESWETPLTYLSNPNEGDALAVFAEVKAARDGYFRPFQFTNIPELGAPYGANWDDYPITEKPLIYLTGLLAGIIGIFAAANFAVMAGQALAAISFYVACRMLSCSWLWSFAGALAFAFSRFAVAHGLHHLTVLYYWHVPLCLVVCEWIMRGEGIKFGGHRFKFALIVAFITGIQHVYYTNIFVEFVLFGGLLQWWRRGWRWALPAVAVIGTALAALVIVNSNTIFYQLVHGGNGHAVVRNYDGLNLYGLKMVDLVIPPPDHRLPFFAAWGVNHLKESMVLPGEQPPPDYLGLLGLGALAWLVMASLRRVAGHAKLPLETFLILWILLYATVGGINGIMGTLGFELFRTSARYSIFILCIALMFAVRRLSLVKFKERILAYGLAILLMLISIVDQTPPWVSTRDLDETAVAVTSDRLFAEEMEKRLPANAMVFQVPIMEFPETPLLNPYDHFLPYLYSHHLRFSFGTVKGRPQEEWQQKLGQMELDALVPKLESYGFSAVYVNRNRYSDKGQNLIQLFKKAGREDMIESDRHDLLCVFLKPSPQPVLPDAN